jgi:hypothetical protein
MVNTGLNYSVNKFLLSFSPNSRGARTFGKND